MTTQERKVMELAIDALENNRQTHHYCEDTWYSCPKHEDGCANESEGNECNCGADKANAEIDKAITDIKEALEQQAAVEHDLAAAYRTELDKLSQRNYELRMENAQLKAQPKEPEQEPVGQLLEDAFGRGQVMWFNKPVDGSYVYTTPPQRKPLTDEQIAKIASTPAAVVGSYVHTFARAIEAAHGIKGD